MTALHSTEKLDVSVMMYESRQKECSDQKMMKMNDKERNNTLSLGVYT